MPKIVTQKKEQTDLMTKFHSDKLIGGHCGQKKLYAKLRNHYYWKGMTKDVAKFVADCNNCQINKPKPYNKEPLVLTPTPQKPFDIIILDTIGSLTKSNNGNQYAVTIMCDLTKYLVTCPIPNKEAKTVTRAIFENFILIYGPMAQVRTDLGSEYMNQTTDALFKLMNIEHRSSTAYHHETLGTVERNHRVFNEYLRSYLEKSF